MSGSKHFDKIAWTVTALMLVVTVLFMNGAALGIEVMGHTMGYENRLFDNTRVHTIDIVMNDWEGFLSTATSEEYSAAHVVIDGEAYKNVGIRGKGNTSLSTVSSMDSERYSFKIEFDQYDSSITYHGLDKLSLNNLIQDTTMMKDYLTYTMMNEFGVDAPLCSFVYITVNGEDWGLYLAVEGVEDAFLTRNYGADYGELYKPDSMSFGGGRGNGKDFDMGDFMNREESAETEEERTMPEMPDMSDMPEMGDFDPSSMFGGGGGKGGFGGMGSSDVKLQYIDDNADSYSNIWNNAKTDITEADQKRLIESLRKLSAGEEIESVVEIEQVIRYFVVHNFVCNGDSYTGSMIHNYYLYEENGRLSMIPWDYNLAFGTFQGGMAQSTVNTPVDSPVSGGSAEDRPMWGWISSNEEYTEMYHRYFEEFLQTVDIAGMIDDAYNLIKTYVEKDPTKFCTYEEFETGVEVMRQFCTLRSESIAAQLANGETVETMDYADASGLNLSDMGSMSMGGGFGGGMPGEGKDRFGGRGETSDSTEASDANLKLTSASVPGGFGGEMPEGFDPSQMQGGFEGEMPEGFDPSQIPGEFDPSQMPGQMPDSAEPPTDSTESGESGTSAESVRPSRGNMEMPGGEFGFNGNGMGTGVSDTEGWIWIAVSALVLCVGLIIAKMYRF